MSIEQNKRVASDFFVRIDANDVSGALALLAEDASYWIAGDKAVIPSAGEHDRNGMSKLFHLMGKAFKDGLRMAVKGITAEGDRVALEVESRGELKNGRVYQQKYHILMTIRDGRIVTVREYLDTQHVYDVWFKSA
ncbi:MAG TPA: nuclear transport factor 2 family protein [Burkholderiales bacterium]|nr:nuclear transport factor 2 family protein [Burkholderiales bacterium]